VQRARVIPSERSESRDLHWPRLFNDETRIWNGRVSWCEQLGPEEPFPALSGC
jgi:hypothetical protein